MQAILESQGERLGVDMRISKQLGEFWDGSYPVILSTVLQKDGSCFEVWLESENNYTLWHNNKQIGKAKTKRGRLTAYKTMVKKFRKENNHANNI